MIFTDGKLNMDFVSLSQKTNIERWCSIEMLKSHNSDENRTYDMGLNQFSAYTDDEFVALFLSPKPYNPEW